MCKLWIQNQFCAILGKERNLALKYHYRTCCPSWTHLILVLLILYLFLYEQCASTTALLTTYCLYNATAYSLVFKRELEWQRTGYQASKISIRFDNPTLLKQLIKSDSFETHIDKISQFHSLRETKRGNGETKWYCGGLGKQCHKKCVNIIRI